MDLETKFKIEECKEKSIALASVSFRMMAVDFVGNQFDLVAQEQVAKSLVYSIRDRVVSRQTIGVESVNTIVPYFDIEFFALYDIFLKENKDQPAELELEPTKSDQEDELPELDAPRKRRVSMMVPHTPKLKAERVTVSELATQLINIVNSHVDATDPKANRVIEEDDSPKNKHKGPLGPDMSTIIQATVDLVRDAITEKLPIEVKEDKSKLISQETETLKEATQEPPKKSKLRSIASVGSIDQLLEFEKIEGDEAFDKKRQSKDDLEINKTATQKQAGQINLHVPRALVRGNTIENFDFLDGNDKLLAREPTALFGAFLNTEQQKKVKPGLNFTTNSLGLLFRLTKTLEKRQKFKNQQSFDESADVLKKIFGPHLVKDGVLSIHNQSLSSLGNPIFIYRPLF